MESTAMETALTTVGGLFTVISGKWMSATGVLIYPLAVAATALVFRLVKRAVKR